MKKKITLIICSIMTLALILCANHENIIKAFTTNNAYWYKWNTKLVLDESIGENIYSVSKSENMSIFTNGYQNAIEENIEALINKSEDSILIHNPFGTNTSSFYYTFNSDETYDIAYNIHVDDESINDFTQNAKTNKIDENTYAYQLIGFVYGKENMLTITYTLDNQAVKTETYTIHMPESLTSNESLNLSYTTSSEALSNGLFTVLGLDKNYNSNIYLYDNDGILRSEYVLKNYRSDRILFFEDSMLYSYKKNGFIKVNSLGRITNIYNFTGYTQHHDFIYDENTNSLLILANENNTDTIEDVIISLNLDSNEVTKIIDMKELLPDLYDLAVSPEEGNTYGGDELDWIHLNSLTLDGDSLIVSSRELSTIIKINEIYTNPTIDYLIADDSLYADSTYATCC